MIKKSPSVVLLAGPNGAGKTTVAPILLKGTLGVAEFVNADWIAKGLSAFDPDKAALAAGRAMIARIRELARQQVSFAFETTLASRSFAPWIEELKTKGYRFHLVFLWLPSADIAVERVKDRVLLGGHDVPEETIRRRYLRGLFNFYNLYQPLAASWRFYDNSHGSKPVLIARGQNGIQHVYNRHLWLQLRQGFWHETKES